MAADAIYVLAEALRTAVEQAAATDGVTLPDRRIVAEGEVAFDCPQLAVQLPRVYRGLAAVEYADVNDKGHPFTCEFVLWLTRCAAPLRDDGLPPAAASIEASARDLLIDAHVLTVALVPELRDVAGRCTSLATGNLLGVGPEGGHTGWQLTVQVGL